MIDRRSLLGAAGASLALATVSSARAWAAAPPLPPIDAFAHTPAVNHVAISPDGKRVAVVSQTGDDKFLLFWALPDGKPETVHLGKVKIRNLFWGSDDYIIVANAITAEIYFNKGDYLSVHSVDTRTKAIQTFFSDKTYPFAAGNLARIKTSEGYRVTASTYESSTVRLFSLYSFSPDGKTRKPIFKTSALTDSYVLTPDGQPVAYSVFDDFRKVWRLFYRKGPNTTPDDFKPIYETKGLSLTAPDLVGLAADGMSLLVFIRSDQHDSVYCEMSPEGVLSQPLDFGGPGKDAFPLFHPSTWRLSGHAYYEDTIVHEYTDPLLAKLYASLPKVLGEGYRSYPVSFAEDPRQMIVYSEGNGDAGSYYAVDFSTGAAIQLASNYPGLDEAWVTQKQAITYKAADGLDIHGYLTLPPFREARALPLVVLPHGGPEARDYIDFDWQVETLASRGYAVLQPNFRGSNGYGESFLKAGYGEWGRKMQTDLSDGVRFLAAKGVIDPKRVAIFGASYGGYAALAGATIDAGVYTCAVSVAGISDVKAMFDAADYNTNYIESNGVLYLRKYLGDPSRFGEISPWKQAARAYCPILLIHGTDDTVVSIEQSQRMEKALKAAGKDVQFITYKGQTHWEDIASSRIEMMTAIVDFIQKYNPA